MMSICTWLLEHDTPLHYDEALSKPLAEILSKMLGGNSDELLAALEEEWSLPEPGAIEDDLLVAEEG